MDLSQVMDNESHAYSGQVDMVEVVADTEDMMVNSMDAESSVNTVMGLVALDETLGSVTATDAESMTDATLTTFRAGVSAMAIASDASTKALFGMDTEASYVTAKAAYVRDVEGIQEFFKKIWEKIKAGLVKANAFFRKTFLKFLNLVSFRKGTLEKLDEDITAATDGNNELKASKFSIVRKMGALAILAGAKGEDVVIDGSTVGLMFPTTTAIDALAASAKTIKGEIETAVTTFNGSEVISEGNIKIRLDELTAAIKDVKIGDGKSKSDMDALEKLDSGTMKKFKNVENFEVIRKTGNGIYVFGITGKNKIETGVVKVKTDKIKTLSGLSGANLLLIIKEATKVNENFKDVIDTAFNAYDASEEIADVFTGIKLDDKITSENKKGMKAVEAIGKNLTSSTPWIAYHTAMNTYKQVGYAIDLGKAYLKDVKDDKDK